MEHNKRIKNKAFTIVELIIAVAIMSILAIYAWRIYFSGSETMRHTVTQSQIQSDMRIFLDKLEPGYLYFLRSPMIFEAASPNSNDFTDDEKAATTVPLKEISEFEVRGYRQALKSESDTNFDSDSEDFPGFECIPLAPEKSTLTTFIDLRLHALKDEVGHRRDEEIDIVTRFYSSVRLAEEANPGYFCSTDHNGSF